MRFFYSRGEERILRAKRKKMLQNGLKRNASFLSVLVICGNNLVLRQWPKIRLTAGDGPKLLEQLDVGLRLDGGSDVRFAAGGVQQGVVVEQAGLVGSLHRR